MIAKTLPRLGLLVLALAVTAQAQTVLTPGHPDLMASELSLDSHILAASVDGRHGRDHPPRRLAER